MTRLRIGYTKAVEEYKDIENDFYSNDSLNNDLKSRFYKLPEMLLETLLYTIMLKQCFFVNTPFLTDLNAYIYMDK